MIAAPDRSSAPSISLAERTLTMHAHDLIRTIDDVELPTAGWWGIAAQQPVSLRTVGVRRRTLSGTVSGGVTIADDPRDSTLDLLICPRDGQSPDRDMVIHASLTSASADGVWRFNGSVEGTVTVPIAVDVRYHGVFRRADRAAAWLTVETSLPGLAGRPRLVLNGDLNADFNRLAA
jgi:hypothetical protein